MLVHEAKCRMIWDDKYFDILEDDSFLTFIILREPNTGAQL
jgi:hypothetical protein